VCGKGKASNDSHHVILLVHTLSQSGATSKLTKATCVIKTYQYEAVVQTKQQLGRVCVAKARQVMIDKKQQSIIKA
jgi:hypothetical protein